MINIRTECDINIKFKKDTDTGWYNNTSIWKLNKQKEGNRLTKPGINIFTWKENRKPKEDSINSI